MDTQRIAQLKKRVSFDRWHERRAPRTHLFVWKYAMSEDQLPRWKRSNAQVLEQPQGSRCIQSMWTNVKEAKKLATIDVYECSSRGEVDDVLLLLLSRSQSMVSPEVGESVGEVTFKGTSSVLFGRANLVICVRDAGHHGFSVAKVAKEVEKDVAREPGDFDSSLGAWFEKQRVSHSLANHAAVTSGQSRTPAEVTLSLPSPSSEPQPLWYKLFSDTGQLSRQHDQLVYRPNTSGEQKIVVYALNARREAARQVLTFSL